MRETETFRRQCFFDTQAGQPAPPGIPQEIRRRQSVDSAIKSTERLITRLFEKGGIDAAEVHPGEPSPCEPRQNRRHTTRAGEKSHPKNQPHPRRRQGNKEPQHHHVQPRADPQSPADSRIGSETWQIPHRGQNPGILGNAYKIFKPATQKADAGRRVVSECETDFPQQKLPFESPQTQNRAITTTATPNHNVADAVKRFASELPAKTLATRAATRTTVIRISGKNNNVDATNPSEHKNREATAPSAATTPRLADDADAVRGFSASIRWSTQPD